MVKKVRVSLHGFQNRGIMVDADATDGARIGKNLFWPDGTVVTEAELRNMQTALAQTAQANQDTQQYIDYILKLLGEGNLGGGGGDSGPYPLSKDTLEDQALVIPDKYQYLVWQEFTVNDTLTVEAGGELVILDEPLPGLRGPDFTYDVNGNLTQIDYDDGSQKLFTYTGDNLTRVDEIRDGVTFRKDFVYSGDELDYITESYP